MKRLLLFVTLSILVLSVALVSAQDDIVIVATDISDLQSLDPAQNGSNTNLAYFYTVYERLYELPDDPSEPLIPNLATGHTVSDDGFVWEFQLRDGVTFASGNPLTAEDVVFSWNRVQNFQNEPAQVFNLFFANVEAVDDLTVRVTLSDAVFPLPVPFIDVLTALPSFSILDSQLLMENGGSVDPAEDTAGEWLNQNSAGSGAFVLENWTPETELVLSRNNEYWGELPAIGGVTLRQVNDSTTALQLVERGDVDIAQNIDKDLVSQVENNDNLNLEAGQTLSIIYVALSPETGTPLEDARVRQAVMQAIDYEGIVTELLGEYAVRPAGVVPLGIMGSEESLSLRYERDVETARALLEEAGVGDELELTLNMSTIPLGGLTPEVLAAKLSADLAEIGITLNVEIDPPTVFRTRRNAGEFSFMVTNFSADFFDPTNWTVLYGLADFQNIAAYMGLQDPDVAEAAFATIFAPPDQRAMAVAGFNQAITDLGLYSVLYQPQTVDVVAANIGGYAFHPIEKVDYASLTRE